MKYILKAVTINEFKTKKEARKFFRKHGCEFIHFMKCNKKEIGVMLKPEEILIRY